MIVICCMSFLFSKYCEKNAKNPATRKKRGFGAFSMIRSAKMKRHLRTYRA